MAAKKKKKPIAKQSSKKSGAAKKPKSKARPAAKPKAKTSAKASAKRAAASKAPAKKVAKKAAPAKKQPAAAKPPAGATKKAAPANKNGAPKKAPAKKEIPRRDGTGHLNPTYAKQLRAQSGATTKTDSTRPAFRVQDDAVAEELGQEVIGKANSGEDEGEDDANRVEVEEVGGPFVVTSGNEEFADGTDESNPEDAEREPFPKT